MRDSFNFSIKSLLRNDSTHIAIPVHSEGLSASLFWLIHLAYVFIGVFSSHKPALYIYLIFLDFFCMPRDRDIFFEVFMYALQSRDAEVSIIPLELKPLGIASINDIVDILLHSRVLFKSQNSNHTMQ